MLNKRKLGLYVLFCVAIFICNTTWLHAAVNKKHRQNVRKINKSSIWHVDKAHDANRFHFRMTNYGIVGHNAAIGRAGAEWPKHSGEYYLFGAGIWVGAIKNQNRLVSVGYALNHAQSEYVPGFDLHPDHNYNYDETERLYLSSDYPDANLPPWPFGYDLQGNPITISDQESYAEYSDVDPTYKFDPACSPLNIQVVQRGFVWENTFCEDVVFLVYTVKNASTEILNATYLGIALDPDIGSSVDDKHGYDHLRNLGYAFDSDFFEGPWERIPGYLGYAMLETPTNTQGKQLGQTAFRYTEMYTDPENDEARYNFMASEIFDTTSKSPADIRNLSVSGPVDMNSGDIQTLGFAIIAGANLEDLQSNTDFARATYYESIKGDSVPKVTLLSPNGNELLAGITEIRWNTEGGLGGDILINLYCSRDGGQTFRFINENEVNDGQYLWNTDEVEDSHHYILGIVAKNDSLSGLDFSDNEFTIDNPKNTAPDVDLLTPTKNITISGNYDITWEAEDADGDSILISLYLSVNESAFWENLVQNEVNDEHYTWDSRRAPNGSDVMRIRIVAFDGQANSADSSGLFSIENIHETLPDSLIQHVNGLGNGLLMVNIADEFSLTDHKYRLTFDDTSSSFKTYSIYDLDLQTYKVTNCAELDGLVEGPIFDGLRLWIKDWARVEMSENLSYWSHGDCNYIISGNTFYPYAADYEIRFTDRGDTTRFPADMFLPFEIWNLMLNSQAVLFHFNPSPTDSTEKMRNTWTSGDEFRIQEQLGDVWKFTHSITLTAPEQSVIEPETGDKALVVTTKPFTYEDVFVFPDHKTGVDGFHLNMPETFSLLQNFPNPFNTSTTINYHLATPGHVLIKIYSLLGQEIKTLVDRKESAGFHRVTWYGKNQKGMNISSGIYFYKMYVRNQNKIRKAILLR